MKRVKLSKEPVLHVHHYIVTISKYVNRAWHTKFRYPLNRIELRRELKAAPKGTYIEVYSATHTFREAWDNGISKAMGRLGKAGRKK